MENPLVNLTLNSEFKHDTISKSIINIRKNIDDVLFVCDSTSDFEHNLRTHLYSNESGRAYVINTYSDLSDSLLYKVSQYNRISDIIFDKTDSMQFGTTYMHYINDKCISFDGAKLFNVEGAYFCVDLITIISTIDSMYRYTLCTNELVHKTLYVIDSINFKIVSL